MMEHQVDLTQLSLDELVLLSSRVELRIKEVLNASAAGSMAHTNGEASGGRFAHSPTGSPRPNNASQEIETLSERVRDLIHANDPCMGGVRPRATAVVAPLLVGQS